MTDGRPATRLESLIFWPLATLFSLPGAAAIAVIAWMARAWS